MPRRAWARSPRFSSSRPPWRFGISAAKKSIGSCGKPALGGRLDATNIVTPEICIITNIGLEHQQYLGQTLAEIAGEKAGIIKPCVPLVSALEEGEAWA